RCAAQPARDSAAPGGRPPNHRVRLRRRSRSNQAAVDGRRGGAVERSHYRDLRQSPRRGSRPDHRRDPARHYARHETRQRPVVVVNRRSARSHRNGHRAREAGRRGSDRRQGTREVPDDRRSGTSVRRRGGRARGAREAPDQLGRGMTATNGRPGPLGPGSPAGSGSPAGPKGPAPPPEIRLTTEWVARAMGGTTRRGDPDRELNGVSIDTRTLTAGELFVAIAGERFNGADFAGTAINAGAGGVVVERGRGRELAQQKGVRPL